MKQTLLIRELGERDLYTGIDYITTPVVRGMKIHFKDILYTIVSIVYEKNQRIILVRKVSAYKIHNS